MTFVQGEAIKHPASRHILQVIMMLDNGKVLAYKLGRKSKAARKYALNPSECERVPLVLPEAHNPHITDIIAGIPDRSTVQRLTPALLASDAFEFFYYEKPTGKLMWSKTLERQHSAGDYVDCVLASGYMQVCVYGRKAYVHRVVWLLVTGSWPSGLVYHLDGNRQNNSINNLAMLSEDVIIA